MSTAHLSARNCKRGTITGAILAGGKSSRMGRSKQDMTLPSGRPMIECVHDAIVSICVRVVVVGESQHVRDLERIADLREGCGPLGGVEGLLASRLDEQYLIVPCDLPLVTAEVLHALLKETDKPATVFERQPLPARLSARALPIVQRLLDSGERAVWRLIDELDAERVPLPEQWVELLENVNAPGDMQRLARRST